MSPKLYLKITLFISVFLLNMILYAQVTPAEKTALQAIYNAFDGPNWTSENDADITNDWDFTQPVTNDWYGVTVVGNNVTILETLSGNNLTGVIPIEIGSLVNLIVLDLENNFISGSIPPELGNLTQLTNLDFHNNQLSGDIPTELNNLINLERVFFFTNSLTGSIPNNWASINSLERLFLNDNLLSGNVPDFSSSPNLIHLSIINNSFEFGDFENQFIAYQSLPIFNYNQQAKVDEIETLNRNQGDNTTITTNCSGSQNNYQWFKDNTPLANNATFTGTQTATLTLTNIQIADAGVYHCEVTSNIVTGLTIERNDITLNVIADNSEACNYAVEVLDFSTQWNTTTWSAQQALGEFDVYPNYGDLINSWASLSQDNQREYLELRFNNPSPISKIEIYETYNAGAIDTVYVKNPIINDWEVVYTATPLHITNSQILEIVFPLTTFNVSEVRIAIDSPAVPGWNEIDAVAINSVHSNAGEDQILTCDTASLTLGNEDCTTDGAIYVWTTLNGNIVSGGATKNIIVDQIGTYTLTVTKYGITVSDDVVVTSNLVAPEINPINNISGCESITLPIITGNNLTGNQQFYTAPNAVGTTYPEGTVLNYADFATYPVTLYAYDSIDNTNCFDETSFTITINSSTQPVTECWETATFNNAICTWDVTGTQPTQPTTECWETATFNNTTCTWEVTGTQPTQPTLECWETTTFNNTTCVWDVTGIEPIFNLSILNLEINIQDLTITMEDTSINYEFSVDGFNYQTDNQFYNLPEGHYTLYVRDENDCLEKTIEFETFIIKFKIPKFFTPNNDNYNDYWKVFDIENTIKNIHIFDRYGKLLKQINPNSRGWNGTFNNRNMPVNDYWYIIRLHSGKIIKGHFTLKR